jgi:hypothetical protein
MTDGETAILEDVAKEVIAISPVDELLRFLV